MLEYTKSELEATDFQSVTHPQDVNDDVAMTKKCMAGDIPGYTMSKRYITKTGRLIWVRLKVIPLYKEGQFVCFLSQIRPIDLPKVPIPLPEPKGKSILHFLKDNWKFVLSTSLAVIVAGYEAYHQWNVMQTTIISLTEALEELRTK